MLLRIPAMKETFNCQAASYISICLCIRAKASAGAQIIQPAQRYAFFFEQRDKDGMMHILTS